MKAGFLVKDLFRPLPLIGNSCGFCAFMGCMESRKSDLQIALSKDHTKPAMVSMRNQER